MLLFFNAMGENEPFDIVHGKTDGVGFMVGHVFHAVVVLVKVPTCGDDDSFLVGGICLLDDSKVLLDTIRIQNFDRPTTFMDSALNVCLNEREVSDGGKIGSNDAGLVFYEDQVAAVDHVL